MRKIFGVLGFLAGFSAAAAPALAACEGQDLIAALPAAERAELQARADARPYAQGNLWTARRGREVIHLVGTYHLPDPRHNATLEALAPALQEAKVILVEATPEEERLLQAEIARRPEFMVTTDGPLLSEQLTEAEWEKLAAEAELRGIPPFMANRFRPWYMAVLLSVPPCATDTLRDGKRGLDHLIMELARVPVRALEPFDTLFSIFGALSAEDETEMVRATLLTVDRPEDMTVTLANAYFAGQSRLLWEFTRSLSEELPDMTEAELERQFALMEDVLMIKRNQRWLPVLEEAATEGPVLAAFGALHLSGDQGVLNLLKTAGFTVTPMGG